MGGDCDSQRRWAWADWADWHLPGGPVGPASTWAATSNVEVDQTSYPVNRGRGSTELETKSQKGGDGTRKWNREGGQGPLAEEGGLYLHICIGSPSL